jgi:hypothetical protein
VANCVVAAALCAVSARLLLSVSSPATVTIARRAYSRTTWSKQTLTLPELAILRAICRHPPIEPLAAPTDASMDPVSLLPEELWSKIFLLVAESTYEDPRFPAYDLLLSMMLVCRAWHVRPSALGSVTCDADLLITGSLRESFCHYSMRMSRWTGPSISFERSWTGTGTRRWLQSACGFRSARTAIL